MENLRESVYECTLAVEAHMICDLLARGGVSARVDGEFLSGAGGDLPLGNTIKVRVDPAHAAEAREIIADWEKLQSSEPVDSVKRPLSLSPLWFIAGLLLGGAVVYLALGSPVRITRYDPNFEGGRGNLMIVDRDLLVRVDVFDAARTRVVARQNFVDGWHSSTDSDTDGDGIFELHIDYDRYGRPR